MKTRIFIFIIFLISNVCLSSCSKKDNEVQLTKEAPIIKIDIPVDKDKKYYATSSEGRNIPDNAFDYNVNTFWAPGNTGINETLFVYIGEIEALGKLTGSELIILDGAKNRNTGEAEYFKPIKYKIQFFNEDILLIEQSVSKEKYEGDAGYPGFIKSDIDFKNIDLLKGKLWLKIIIMETENEGNASIRDIKISFKGANPHSAFEEIKVFCDGINAQNKKVISNFTEKPVSEILEQFTSEFVPEDGPGCDIESLEVHSEYTVSLFTTEGGDGGGRAYFKFENGKWKLYTFSYFSLF